MSHLISSYIPLNYNSFSSLPLFNPIDILPQPHPHPLPFLFLPNPCPLSLVPPGAHHQTKFHLLGGHQGLSVYNGSFSSESGILRAHSRGRSGWSFGKPGFASGSVSDFSVGKHGFLFPPTDQQNQLGGKFLLFFFY